MNTYYREYRCKVCHKLLFKGILIEGDIQIKCKYCHEYTTVIESSLQEYLCGIKRCPQRIPLIKKD